MKKPNNTEFKPVKMAWGGYLDFDVSRSIGWGAKTTGVVDLSLSELLCHLIRSGDSVLDIGANVGGITCLMARLVGAKGSVDAFEPHPQAYKSLVLYCNKNLGRNLDRVKNHFVAVGESPAKGFLVEDPNAMSDGEASIKENKGGLISHAVDIVALKDLLAKKRYSVMKLDVEGYELPVLRGAGDLITGKKIANILFEDHLGIGSPVFDFLKSSNYYLYSFGWGLTGVKVMPIEKGNLNKPFEAPNYWASSFPVENFFFKGWKCFKEIMIN